MVQNDNVTLLKMESVEVVQSVLGLTGRQLVGPSTEVCYTYVHHVIKYNESCASSLLFRPNADLTNTAISPKQVVQIFARDLVVEILDEEYPICTWRQFCLNNIS